MLDATQPWLPLLDDELRVDLPARKPRRRAVPVPQASKPGSDDRAVRRAFMGVASSWSLTAREALQLLGEPLSSEAERLERLHGILGVHRSLLTITPEPARYTELLRRPEPAFDGASPLGIMLQQGLPGIARVRDHLLARITG